MGIDSRTDFLAYLGQARHLLEHARVPGFEQHFENLETFNPVFNYLDSIVFILDLRTGQFPYLSPNSEEIQGYTADEVIRLGAQQALELYHPVDAEIVINQFFPDGLSEHRRMSESENFRSKVSYNYRLRQKDGSYLMLLQQFSFLMFDEEYNPLMIMGTISNINDIHQKPELFCRIHTLGRNHKWLKRYERFVSLAEKTAEFGLSPKELEIIAFVNKGMSSKEIASLTSRSVETINVQRKRILAKTNCQSMTEVIALAHRNGWL